MPVDDLDFAEFSQASREAWHAAVDKVLKGADFERRMVARTEDGLAIQPLYTADDGAADAGVPGRFPFIRGAAGDGARWRAEQRQAHPDPKTANAQALDDLAKGMAAVRFVIADPLAAAAEGVVLPGPQELEALLAGIMTDIAPVSLEAGSRATGFARALVDLVQARGHGEVGGDLHVDPLAVLARHGKLDRSLDEAARDIAELLAAKSEKLAAIRTLGVDLRLGHEAGAGPSLELAIGLAHAAEMLRLFEGAGVDPARAAAETTFLVPVDDDIFMGIAKLRALRRAWSTMVRAVGGAAAPRLVAETSRRMLATRDAYVNLLRNTVAAFAAGAGSADAVTVLPFTAAIGLPDKTARRMARNTQLILMEEAGLDHVVDPAGGSWYVENLTDQLADAAWRAFQAIEAEGGFLQLLESGGLHARIAAQWDKRAKGLATRREMITGVSSFPLLDEHAVELDPFDAEPLFAKLTAPPARLVVDPLPRRRLAEPFEALRDRADAATERPTVLLLQLGTLAEATVRATWIKNLVEAGGLRAEPSAPASDVEAIRAALADARPAFVILCSTDARYEALAVPAAEACKAAGVATVGLAGRPGDHEAAWRAAGIDVFLYQGMNVLAELEAAHQRLGLAA